MQKRTTTPIIALALLLLFGQGLFAQNKKLAQTGIQILSVPPDARAAAMGEAFTTIAGQSNSIFYNPANLARTSGTYPSSINQNNWIADIKQASGSFSYNPMNGNLGVLALSYITVNYGDLYGTRVDPSTDKGYIDTGIFSPSAFVLGVGYAKSLTDRFSVGGQVKYVSQTLGESLVPVGDYRETGETEIINYKAGVLAYDFGTLYRTGYKSLVFGMSVRNFSREVVYETEGFQLPLNFQIGISMNVFDFFESFADGSQALLVAIDATHPRAFGERVNIGAEYMFYDIFALRGGYKINYDQVSYTVGFGIQKEFGDRKVAFDYSLTPFGLFDTVQRMSFRLVL